MNIASFQAMWAIKDNAAIIIVVIITCNKPPITAYFFMAENFSIENSRPIINRRNITPNSAIWVIMSVELISWPNIIPVRKSPIIDGSLSLLNINRIITAVIKITDILSNKIKSINIYLPNYVLNSDINIFMNYLT